MGVEAAGRAFNVSQYSRDDIKMVAMGTTTPPLEEGDITGQLVEMLGLLNEVEGRVFLQPRRAGVRFSNQQSINKTAQAL